MIESRMLPPSTTCFSTHGLLEGSRPTTSKSFQKVKASGKATGSIKGSNTEISRITEEHDMLNRMHANCKWLGGNKQEILEHAQELSFEGTCV